MRITSDYDGDADLGTVFKVTPAGQQSVVRSFAGGRDGSNPSASLTLGAAGTLFGTTTYGGGGTLIQGSDGSFYGLGGYFFGTFFRVTPTGLFT